jgi:hypothetical protein
VNEYPAGSRIERVAVEDASAIPSLIAFALMPARSESVGEDDETGASTMMSNENGPGGIDVALMLQPYV